MIETSTILNCIMSSKPDKFIFLLCDSGVVAESDSTIENAVKALGKTGFINYFGLQVGHTDSWLRSLVSKNRSRVCWDESKLFMVRTSTKHR